MAADEEGDTRDCLVCGQATDRTRLSVNVCSSCTLFYRRAQKRNRPFDCKTGDHNCDLKNETGAQACKKCRYARFIAVLENAYDGPVGKKTRKEEPDTLDMPVLERLKEAYTLSCQMRTTSETAILESSKEFREIFDGQKKFYEATFDKIEPLSRSLMSALCQFCATAFPRYGSFSKDEKDQIVRNTMEVFLLVEASFQALKFCPNEDDLLFTSYCSFVRKSKLDKFLETQKGCEKEHMMKVLSSFIEEMGECKKAMKKHAIDEVELVAILGLELFDAEKPGLSERAMKRMGKNRRKLLTDLRFHYDEVGKGKACDERIGNLSALLQAHRAKVPAFRESFTHRLPDVIDVDKFVYQLARS